MVVLGNSRRRESEVVAAQSIVQYVQEDAVCTEYYSCVLVFVLCEGTDLKDILCHMRIVFLLVQTSTDILIFASALCLQI